VDRRFYDSYEINREVAFPVEFEIGFSGLTYQPRFVDFMFSGTPLSARQPNMWHALQEFNLLTIEAIDDGIITLAVDGFDKRLRVDLGSEQIEALVYYADGAMIEMVRLNPNISPGRYRYEEPESGGLRITYIADFQEFRSVPEFINVYRSTVLGDVGERILTHAVVDADDSIFFKFVDYSAERGVTYFYTVKMQSQWLSNRLVAIGGETQMAVQIGGSVYEADTAHVVDIADDETLEGEVVESDDEYETDEEQGSSGFFVVGIVGVTVVAVVVIMCVVVAGIIKKKRG